MSRFLSPGSNPVAVACGRAACPTSMGRFALSRRWGHGTGSWFITPRREDLRWRHKLRSGSRIWLSNLCPAVVVRLRMEAFGGDKGRSAIEKWTVVLYVLASSSAVLAIAGGVALMFGAADFREAAGETLGGAGPAVVGGALIAVLGIPMVSASSALYRNTRNAGRVAVGAGLVLLALIAIDAIVVGQFTWIYLPLGAVGLAMFAGGTHLRRLVHLDRSRPAVTTTDVRDAPPAVELDNPTERQRDRWANDGGRLTDDPRWATDREDAARARRDLDRSANESGPAVTPSS